LARFTSALVVNVGMKLLEFYQLSQAWSTFPPLAYQANFWRTSPGMIATPDHLYGPKKETDYILWNRLNQVDNARRLDKADNTNG
jgi:hypothetical protein